VERHNCINCDVFKHTYDKLERYKFSDNCGVHHKIYNDFLLIIIVVHLTCTFCDDDLFVTMASPKYKI
jgi:ribosomal protein L33